MIQHFLEVWLFLVTAFVMGCVLGAVIYMALAATFLAPLQVALARAVRSGMDGVLERLGAAPAWREYQYVPTEEPLVRDDYDDGTSVPRLPAPLPARTASTDGDATGTQVSRAPTGPTPMRPMALLRPRNGVPDNLQRIRGIGRKTERRLNEIGIFHFGQIAAWTPGEVRWISDLLDYPDRIDEHDWIGQAVVLASDDAAGVERGVHGDRRDQLFRDADDEPEVYGPVESEEAYDPVYDGSAGTEDDDFPDDEAYDAGDPYDERDDGPDGRFESEPVYGPPEEGAGSVFAEDRDDEAQTSDPHRPDLADDVDMDDAEREEVDVEDADREEVDVEDADRDEGDLDGADAPEPATASGTDSRVGMEPDDDDVEATRRIGPQDGRRVESNDDEVEPDGPEPADDDAPESEDGDDGREAVADPKRRD